jgi:F-type H+-transporting ATPase subunit delta
MVEGRIGYKYAKPLFEQAEEDGTLEQLRQDMETIRDTCEQSRELGSFLKSPVVNAAKKKAVLEAIFGKSMKSEKTVSYLDFIVEHGREDFLPDIASTFLKLYDDSRGIVRGTLTSATPLDDATIAGIKRKVEQEMGGTFYLETKTDPAMLGGFTLEIGDRYFDGSVTTALRRLKQEFSAR